MSASQARLAGLVALSVVIVAVLATIISSGPGQYELRARFDDVRGLIPGGQVRAGAISVGKVDSITLDARNRPVVAMKIDRDFRVHEGAIANIKLGSNAGVVNRVVELTHGDTGAPTLPPGTTLRGNRTDQPVNFDEAMQTLDPPTRRNIKRFLIGLDTAFVGRGGDILRTLRHAPTAVNESANLLAQVNEDAVALRTMVRQGDRVAAALASDPRAIGEATELTATLLRTSAGRAAELRRSVVLLAPGLVRGRVLLQRLGRAVPNLRRLVTGLTPVVDELEPFAREVPPVAAAAVPFLREGRRLVEGVPADLIRLKPILRAADPVADTLTPVISSAMPFLQTLRTYVPDVVGGFQNLGSIVGGYDANGHAINALVAVGRPSSTQGSTIGPGDCTPGLLPKPYLRYPGAAACQPWADFEDSFIAAPGADG